MLYQVKKLWFLFLCSILLLFWTSMAQDWTTESDQASTNTQSSSATSSDNFWVDMNSKCMLDGTCSFSIYDATKVKKDRAPGERTSVMNFIQDIVLGATMFIGTVVTVALILSGFFYVFSTVDSSLKKKAKDGIKYSLIGMVVVMLSLVIIRLVQFLARGGS